MRNKILIIVQNLPVPFDRRVWLEATSLKSRGYEVSVICPKKYGFNKSYEVIEDVQIFRYPLYIEANKSPIAFLLEFGLCFLFTFLLSFKVLIKRGFNIIHICNPPETYFPLAFIYRLTGKKIVFDHHDLSPEMYLAKDRENEQTSIYYKLLLLCERLTFRVSDLVITTNNSHKSIAEKRGSFNSDKIYVVRSGPDLSRFNGYRHDDKLKNGKKYLVCYLGEMCKQDGVELFLRELAAYDNEFLKRYVQFTFIGKGPEQPYLKELSYSLQLQSYVNFSGRVSDNDLANYLRTSDVCFDTSPYNSWTDKSTMNKIIEYMAFSKPIVSFDLTETKYSAGKAAIYVGPGNYSEFFNEIEKLLLDDEKRKNMGEYAKKRFEDELSWEYSEKILFEAYSSLNGFC